MHHDDITGVWILRTLYMENVQTGERSEQFGPEPKGTLILHPGGRMVVVITPAEQIPSKTEADRAAAFQTLIAYSGRYRLEPPNQFVTSVDIAWFQPWVGTEQARTYNLNGDTLDIVGAPTRVPRNRAEYETIIGVLSWKREAEGIVSGS